VVGGSTLYFEALAHGLSPIPQTSGEARLRLNAQVEAGEAETLFRRLQTLDPASAATMDPTKTQRIVRALEVLEETGRTLSSYHDQRGPPPHRFSVVVLDRPRDELYDRIERRVDAMLDEGLLDENRALLGYPDHLPALRTIGYQEPRAYLRGEIGHDEMVERLKRNTRRYAKRQLTWFRRRPEYHWLGLSAFPTAESAADRVFDLAFR
jgi:tRNA dimethylallyltransferase